MKNKIDLTTIFYRNRLANQLLNQKLPLNHKSSHNVTKCRCGCHKDNLKYPEILYGLNFEYLILPELIITATMRFIVLTLTFFEVIS